MTPSTTFPSRRLRGAVLAAILLLTGCATTGSDMLAAMQPADPRLTEGDDAKFFSRSGYQACAAAAAVGVLACALSNSGNKAVCAVAAGVAACGVAMGANYYMDQRRSQYANTSDRLNAMSNDIEADTQMVIARTQTAQGVIADDKRQIAELQKQVDDKSVDMGKAKQHLARTDKNIALLQKELGNMRNKVTQYQEVAELERANGDHRQIAALDRNIATLNQQVSDLEQEVNGLYAQRTAIRLG